MVAAKRGCPGWCRPSPFAVFGERSVRQFSGSTGARSVLTLRRQPVFRPRCRVSCGRRAQGPLLMKVRKPGSAQEDPGGQGPAIPRGYLPSRASCGSLRHGIASGVGIDNSPQLHLLHPADAFDAARGTSEWAQGSGWRILPQVLAETRNGVADLSMSSRLDKSRRDEPGAIFRHERRPRTGPLYQVRGC